MTGNTFLFLLSALWVVVVTALVFIGYVYWRESKKTQPTVTVTFDVDPKPAPFRQSQAALAAALALKGKQ